MKKAPATVVCECVYFGECFAFVVYVSGGLGEEIVVRGEPCFRCLKGFTEIAPGLGAKESCSILSLL